MAVITIFNNAFSDEYEQFQTNAGSKIKDVVRTCEASLIFVNGKKEVPDYTIQEDDVCLIRILPEAQIAAPALFWYFAYQGVDALTSGGLSDQMGKFSSWTAGKVGEWLGIKNPESPTSSDRSIASIPQIRGSKNQIGLGKTIPLVLGKHLFTPYFVGSPYTFIDPNDGSQGANQYFCGLYMLGYSNLKISDIKLGELLLASNTSDVMNGSIAIDGKYDASDYSIALEIQQSSEVSIYSQKVVEQQLSVSLLHPSGQNPNKPIKTSSINPQRVQIEIFINGLAGFSDKGVAQDRAVAICAQWRPANTVGDETGWVNFPMFQGATTYQSDTHASVFNGHITKQMRFISTYNFSYNQVSGIPEGYVEIRLWRNNDKANDGRTNDDVSWTSIRTWCFDKEKINFSE